MLQLDGGFGAKANATQLRMDIRSSIQLRGSRPGRSASGTGDGAWRAGTGWALSPREPSGHLAPLKVDVTPSAGGASEGSPGSPGWVWSSR